MAIDGVECTFDASGVCRSRYKQPTVIPSEEEKSETHHSVDAMADKVLAQITNDQMSKTEKAKAIYTWVRSNIRYVSRAEKATGYRSHTMDFAKNLETVILTTQCL